MRSGTMRAIHLTVTKSQAIPVGADPKDRQSAYFALAAQIDARLERQWQPSAEVVARVGVGAAPGIVGAAHVAGRRRYDVVGQGKGIDRCAGDAIRDGHGARPP